MVYCLFLSTAIRRICLFFFLFFFAAKFSNTHCSLMVVMLHSKDIEMTLWAKNMFVIISPLWCHRECWCLSKLQPGVHAVWYHPTASLFVSRPKYEASVSKEYCGCYQFSANKPSPVSVWKLEKKNKLNNFSADLYRHKVVILILNCVSIWDMAALVVETSVSWMSDGAPHWVPFCYNILHEVVLYLFWFSGHATFFFS